jgi:hypothetical protein
LSSLIEGCHSCSDLENSNYIWKIKKNVGTQPLKSIKLLTALQDNISPYKRLEHNLIMVNTVPSIFQVTTTTLITVAIGAEFGQPF